MDATDKKAFADWVRQVTLTGYKARHEFKRVGRLPDFVMNDVDVKSINPLGNDMEISDYLVRHGIRRFPAKNIPNLLVFLSIFCVVKRVT